MGEVAQWNGAERRTGMERRTGTGSWADAERRRDERRRGGVGTHHPDPTEQLLQGIDPPETLAFEPAAGTTGDMVAAARETTGDGVATDESTRQDGGARSHMPMASERAALLGTLAPAHEQHEAIPSAAAIAGHPLHPAVVPLPMGAFAGALVADIAFAATRDPFFARAGRLLTLGGVITGALAAILGGIDFWSRSRIRSHRAAWFHAGGNAATLVLGGVSLALRSRGERAAVVPAGLLLSAISGLVLVVTGWLGGELSYRHRVGMTEQEERA